MLHKVFPSVSRRMSLSGSALGGLDIRAFQISWSVRGQNGPQLLAIGPFRGPSVRVTHQMCDVLHRHPCARQQRDEAVPKFSWSPLFSCKPGVSRYLRKGAPNVCGVEGGATLGGKPE
jgi:hypothetical protein